MEIKNKPIGIQDEIILFPSSTENNNGQVYFEKFWYNDGINGRWEKIGPVCGLNISLVYGANMIPAIYGIPVIYSKDNWPNSAHKPLGNQEMKALVPPDLDSNLFFKVSWEFIIVRGMLTLTWIIMPMCPIQDT